MRPLDLPQRRLAVLRAPRDPPAAGPDAVARALVAAGVGVRERRDGAEVLQDARVEGLVGPLGREGEVDVCAGARGVGEGFGDEGGAEVGRRGGGGDDVARGEEGVDGFQGGQGVEDELVLAGRGFGVELLDADVGAGEGGEDGFEEGEHGGVVEGAGGGPAVAGGDGVGAVDDFAVDDFLGHEDDFDFEADEEGEGVGVLCAGHDGAESGAGAGGDGVAGFGAEFALQGCVVRLFLGGGGVAKAEGGEAGDEGAGAYGGEAGDGVVGLEEAEDGGGEGDGGGGTEEGEGAGGGQEADAGGGGVVEPLEADEGDGGVLSEEGFEGGEVFGP